MAKNYVMVIDEGTTGTRSLIFDKSLNIIASSYTEFTQYTPASDKVEHDAMEIYDKSIQMCRQAMEQASISSDDIACIGITVRVAVFYIKNNCKFVSVFNWFHNSLLPFIFP